MVPAIADDKIIDSNSIFTLVNATKTESSSIVYNFGATMSVNAITQVIDFPFNDSGSGSWIVKEGDATVKDSVIVTQVDGTTTRYELLSLEPDFITLRTRQNIDFEGQVVNALIQFGFVREQ